MQAWHDQAMAGPNKQFDQDQALDKALQLFWMKGYESTSMQELVDVMGVNRASMYQTYGNKYDLYVASMDRYIDSAIDLFNEVLEQPGPALENLHTLFQNMVLSSLQGGFHGCFINNTAVELSVHDPKLAKKIRDVWVQFEDVFAKMAQRAIGDGELRAGIDSHTTAQLLNITLQGLMIQSKTNISKEKLFDSIDLVFRLIRV